jgi:hypothetical protein
MPRYKVTLQRTVTFTKVVEVEAENDLIAGDKAENIAESPRFEWDSADGDETEVMGADEIK